MKKCTYLDFVNGIKMTIRAIWMQESSIEDNMTYCIVELEETDERVRLCLQTPNMSLIKPKAVLTHSKDGTNVKGEMLWNSGLCFFYVESPQEA